MKLKRTLSMTLAAVLASSAIGAVASAAGNVPTPKNSDEAFVYAESLNWDGLYYEAKEMLETYVTNPNFYYQAKKNALISELNEKIYRWEVKQAIKAIEDAWNDGDVVAASVALANAKAMDYNMDEFYSINWWDGIIADALAKQADISIKSEADAIAAVKGEGVTLQSPNEWFSAKKINSTTYAVDLVTSLFNESKTIAQWFVDIDTRNVTPNVF